MIKKITLAMIMIFLLISCGKKGDPKYTVFNKNITNQSNLSNIA